MRGSESGREEWRGSGEGVPQHVVLTGDVEALTLDGADLADRRDHGGRDGECGDDADELADDAAAGIVARDASIRATLVGGDRAFRLRDDDQRCLEDRRARERRDLDRGEGEGEVPEQASEGGHRHGKIPYRVRADKVHGGAGFARVEPGFGERDVPHSAVRTTMAGVDMIGIPLYYSCMNSSARAAADEGR